MYGLLKKCELKNLEGNNHFSPEILSDRASKGVGKKWK